MPFDAGMGKKKASQIALPPRTPREEARKNRAVAG